MKYAIISACFAVLVTAGIARASDHNVMLYKDFYYGMERSEVQKRSGALPCNVPEAEGALCLDGHVFAGVRWLQIFAFSEGALTHIMLAGELSPSNFAASMGAIMNNKFIPVKSQSGDETCDYIVISKNMSKAESDAYSKKFEARGFREGRLKYTFFDENSMNATYGASNVYEIFKRAPITLREVVVELSSKLGDSWLDVSFFAPKMTEKKLTKQLEQSKDSF